MKITNSADLVDLLNSLSSTLTKDIVKQWCNVNVYEWIISNPIFNEYVTTPEQNVRILKIDAIFDFLQEVIYVMVCIFEAIKIKPELLNTSMEELTDLCFGTNRPDIVYDGDAYPNNLYTIAFILSEVDIGL